MHSHVQHNIMSESNLLVGFGLCGSQFTLLLSAITVGFFKTSHSVTESDGLIHILVGVISGSLQGRVLNVNISIKDLTATGSNISNGVSL